MLSKKYEEHPQAMEGWHAANRAIKGMMKEAAGCSATADHIYATMPEPFMNRIVDDLNRLYCMAWDRRGELQERKTAYGTIGRPE